MTLLTACNQTPRTQAPATTPAPTTSATTAATAPIRSQAVFTPAAPSAQVSFSLEGCRNDGSPVITLPNSGGKFICPDAAYTSGNLGKGWNELDLVPHRLTASVGNQANATTTFSVILAADYQLGTKTGYDVVTVPEINAAKSDASCQLTVQDQQIGGGVTGGADTVVYRTLNITLDRGRTCVIDYANRLALGAAQYSGSSLQAYMFEKSDFSTGKRTIPLPVREIQPQSIAKEMSASQGRDQVWDVIKQPTPATLNFGDVCAPGAVTEKAVQIRVAWEIVNVVPGNVTLLTRIYATNPAARVITVDVTDRMYRGTDQSQGVLDSAASGPRDVPANTANVLILSHTYALVTTDNLVGAAFNDVATATYTDKVTGIPVPGTTTATASTTVSAGSVTNASAAIADSESITGPALTFSVAPTTLGSFSGYTPGTFVTGPVNWSVAGQTAAGSVTFSKTVRLGNRVVTSGTLSDTATLTGSDGFADSASASVDISSAASVSVTIRKTIPDVLQAGESQSFTFVVKNSAGVTVATPSVTFAAGQTTQSVTVGNLDPGTYTVSEQAEAGWATRPDQSTTIALPSCSGSVSFANAVDPARAKVEKTTVPAGGQQGWAFTLLNADTNASVATGTTDASGHITFPGTLAEGNYRIVETAQAGYDLTGSTGCIFSVNYPADGGKTFTCAATNTKRGNIVIRKVTLPAASTQGFEFTPSYGAAFTLKTGESSDSGAIVPGTYSVAEAVPAGWDQTSAICDDGSPVTAIDLNAGETVTCTFTNTQRGHLIVDKITLPAGDPQSFAFTTTGSGYAGFSLTDTAAPNDQLLPPGVYGVTETVPTGWTQTAATCSDGSPLDAVTLSPGETVTCTVKNTKNATVIVRKVMVGGSGAFGFSGTPSGTISTSGGTLQASVVPGTYVTTESTVPGWDLTAIACDDGDSSGSLAMRQATFNAQAGETVTCTFTNTKRGQIIVRKVTVPSGDPTTFAFSTDYSGSFGLSDGQSNTSTPLVPGTYAASETVPAGWAQTGATCSDGSAVGAIALAAGETVTCTFTNSRLPKIVIQKVTKPMNTGSFGFTATGTNYASFTLGGGGQNVQTVVPGAYTVREQTQLGWILTGIGGNTTTPTACLVSGNGGSSGTGNVNTQTATITVKYGDTVTCVFENTGQGVTRTQGFWATHPQLALIAWSGGSAFGHTFPGVAATAGLGDALLCGKPVVAGTLGVGGSSDLMGGFWSGISKTSTNGTRSALDQGRMQLLQQMIAAQLNASAFGSVPTGGSGMFATWEAAYCGTNAAAISAAQAQAAGFNTAGDSGTFTPGTSADSKGARAMANLRRWDTLP
ncbi:SpaA isopeptide-forming pilin-related protein [Deinococcus yunweiensis]|uniref:prealbumin-like fold domain-containing protein n=1 Tax=Deinococcus yunweiensis TaxID=367282 RepID=UPI00398E38DA